MYLKTITFIVVSVICFLNVILWPVNKYEWMLDDDPNMALPIDHNAEFYAVLALLPLFILLLFLIKKKYKYENYVVLSVFFSLFFFWLFKFVV